MNVEQLIKELMKIEDKTKKVYLDDENDGSQLLRDVEIDTSKHSEPVLLKWK